MSLYKNDEENIPADNEAYYEAAACQEEIYLEEVEEEVRAILIFGDPPPSQRQEMRSMSDANNDFCVVESLDEQLDHAAEELITGDSDDPPLREETVVEMIRMTHTRKTSRSVS